MYRYKHATHISTQVSKLSHADVTAEEKSVLSEYDDCFDPAPGNNVSKIRGRARHTKVKRGIRPRPYSVLNCTCQPIDVKHLFNRPKGCRKVMSAHHYRLKPGEGSTVSIWLRKKQPKFRVLFNMGPFIGKRVARK